MDVLISKQIGGLYSVIQAKKYTQSNYRQVTKHRGYNFLNQDLGYSISNLKNLDFKYVQGDAVSSTMTYNQCIEFIKDNNLNLINIELHTTFYTELHSRYFK